MAVSVKEGSNGCIYATPHGLCDGTHPLHKKEHYLPAGLGNFKNDIRLRNYICTNCQGKFGSLEDVFLHNSPEAFFRFITGKKGRRSHRKKDIFYEPTHGIAPITVKARDPGQSYQVLCEMTGINEGMPMKQLVFKDKKGDFHQLPFRPGYLAGDFSKFMKERKTEDFEIVGYYGDGKKEEDEIHSVCTDFLKGKASELVLPVSGIVEGVMQAAVTIPYLRAVAKIAFHFVLAHFDFKGFEPQFNDIKRFIFTGEHHERFVKATMEPFVKELKNPQAHIKHWSHLLKVQHDYDTLEAQMQFFVGPVVTPFVWRVMFGNSPSRVVGTYGKAFEYRYYDKPDKEGYVGTISRLESA
jgi:hypothetical protein